MCWVPSCWPRECAQADVSPALGGHLKLYSPSKVCPCSAGPEHLSRGSSPHNASGKTGFELMDEKAAGGSFRGDQLWLLAPRVSFLYSWCLLQFSKAVKLHFPTDKHTVDLGILTVM